MRQHLVVKLENIAMRPFANDQTTAEAFSQLKEAVLSVLNFSSYIKKIRSLLRKYGLNV